MLKSSISTYLRVQGSEDVRDTLDMDPTAQIKSGLRRAAEKFARSVPPRLSSQFTGDAASLPSLKDEIRAIQTELGAKGSMRDMPRLKKFIEAMIQFGLTIEVFVNANDFVCFIWVSMLAFGLLMDVYE